MWRVSLAKRAFPHRCEVQAVMQLSDGESRYAAGKIIGGVCHGPIFLANVKAPDGSYVVRAQQNFAAAACLTARTSHSPTSRAFLPSSCFRSTASA